MKDSSISRSAVLKFAALALSVFGCVLVSALPAGAAGPANSGNDTCGYAASSFTESTVMRWAQINGTGTSAQFIAYANDEKGLLLGVNGATPMSGAAQNGSNGQSGAVSHYAGNASGGDITAKDPSGRLYFPALYITNLTAHPSSNGTGAGDFQNGGTPGNVSGGHAFIDDVFGSWSTATVSSGSYSVTPPPSKNDWNLGVGSDAPVGTTFANMGDEGYGAEVRWNVSELRDSNGNLLTPGNTYRFQVIEHDGDQNKTGGDAGEFCANLTIPGLNTTATTGTTVGQPITDQATLKGSGASTASSGSITWNVYASSDTTCSNPVYTTPSVTTNGDGTYTSPPFTPASPGSYKWVASYSGTNPAVSVNNGCTDKSEVSVVNQATPGFTTTATTGIAGQPVVDHATVTGGDNPGGSITWKVFDGSDSSCSTPLFTSTAVSVSGDGDYTSPSWTPANSGNYQWVATYSGDANNVGQTSGCGNEPFTVQPAPAPSMHLTKLESFSASSSFGPGPLTGAVGQTVYYQMNLINTGNTPLTIQFSDTGCDANTLSGPVVLNGSYDAASSSLASGAELQWTCSHVLSAADVAPTGYTNTASATATPPSGDGTVPPQSASVVAFSNSPGLQVVKLQRDGSTGGFTADQITGTVGDTINYEIQVTNTGNVPLTLSLSDPHCDAASIAGPTAVSGTLNGDVLAASGVAQYTCSHVLSASDIPSYTNVGTITGTPPSGPPLSGTGIVVTNVTQAAIKVLKLQSLSASGPFSSSTLTANVGQTIYYEIQATNTGNAPLTLHLTDPMCDSGSLKGPVALSGTLNGVVLSPNGEAQYTCSHVLLAADTTPFTNTATVTGTPPSGPPVSGTSSVAANKAAVLAKKVKKCPAGTLKKTKRNKKGKKVIACVAKKLSRKPKTISGFTG